MAYKCSICGQVHDDLPMDIAFRKPQDYLNVPEWDRARRVRINDDICIIDEKVYVIRGYLPVKVRGSKQPFAWGVWVIVDKASFQRYLELWSVDGSKEPPFRGRLSAIVPGYPDTYLLEADVHLRTAKERPLIRLRPSDHPFAQEQMRGITMARVHEILETAFPGTFKGQ